jgi:hypothetical protein
VIITVTAAIVVCLKDSLGFGTGGGGADRMKNGQTDRLTDRLHGKLAD